MAKMQLVALFLVGCDGGGDGPSAEDDVTPVCDGLLQEDELGLVDRPFDKDGDGYVDGADPNCRANYGANRLDCDDANVSMHPDQAEVFCNGLDDDCNPETGEAEDVDQDTVLSCDDCDDLDPLRYPGNVEVCWDEVDNDCDLQVDPDCGPDFNGLFDLNMAVEHECRVLGIPFIGIAFDQIGVDWRPPEAEMAAVDSTQPGRLEGTIDPATGDFLLQTSVLIGTPAACDEFYTFEGNFSDADTFTMTFTAEFSGGICGGCDGIFVFPDLVGVRVPGP